MRAYILYITMMLELGSKESLMRGCLPDRILRLCSVNKNLLSVEPRRA